ncbi:acyl-CoA dehydrogenase family protein [Pseudophaeobacter arcticus]|uniref:acyl-CoA dehydrogenase family protein n=1 Tax=Pseudophaeobacter arcticus TaxID=385492 RepID=UPI0039E397E2
MNLSTSQTTAAQAPCQAPCQAPNLAHWETLAQVEVAPFASQIDQQARVPAQVISALRQAGAFASGFTGGFAAGATAAPAADPADALAAALDHGHMHQALGAASASVQGVLNVHHMGGSALAKWSSKAQKSHWMPKLLSGEICCAIAMTEPEVGSDISAVQTQARPVTGGYELTGQKAWITCGDFADLFVVIARTEAGPTAFLLPKQTPGLRIDPIDGMLGCRGYMMANLHLEAAFLPEDHLLGRPGFGASHVAVTGLEAGRLNLAWGCVGLAEAACQLALRRAKTRQQFGAAIGDFQLVQQLLARMATDIHAARLMCQSASSARALRQMDAAKQATMAKYFASQMVGRVTRDAQQIFGAEGIGGNSPMALYYRDSRIMEVIEGTTQVLESLIARLALSEVALS